MKRLIRIGTRKSMLALFQTEIVKNQILQSFPDIQVEIIKIDTRGDLHPDTPLATFGGKGAFTAELEEGILSGMIDLAVHSAKDMPMDFPEGLAIGAVLERGDVRDCFVTTTGKKLSELEPGSIVGTGSLRRELMIQEINPGVSVQMLRGNVQTRIRKLKEGRYDGIILAAAGIERLGMRQFARPGMNTGKRIQSERPGINAFEKTQFERPGINGIEEMQIERPGLEQIEGIYIEYMDPERFIPAAGQGILAVETRADDRETAEILAAIHCEKAACLLEAERVFLRSLGGGCNAPAAGYCREENGRFIMHAMYAKDGNHRTKAIHSIEFPEDADAYTRFHLAGKLGRMIAAEVAGSVAGDEEVQENNRQ